MRAVVTPDDLKRGELISKAGWAPCELVAYDEKPADTDGSTNCTFSWKIIDGPDSGKQTRVFCNEKALGFLKNFYKVFSCPQDEAGNYVPSSEYFKGLVGEKCLLYLQRGKSNQNKEFNEVTDYKPLA